MPPLSPCPACGRHHRAEHTACPHCAAPLAAPGAGLRRSGAAALVLGLLAGCDGGFSAQPPYGIPDTGEHPDRDGDGYTTADDCDDEDESVNPGATEVPGDGVDSNCDGQDDT